jgi:hypothetical protein
MTYSNDYLRNYIVDRRENVESNLSDDGFEDLYLEAVLLIERRLRGIDLIDGTQSKTRDVASQASLRPHSMLESRNKIVA